MTTPRRLLLLEFVGSSALRNERADFFPYYKGLAESGGVGTLWLCAGAGFEGLEKSPTQVVEIPVLSRGDEDELARRVADWAPTHVLANEALGPRLRRLLTSAAPHAELLTSTADHRKPRAGERTALDIIAEREGWGKSPSGKAPPVPRDLPVTRFYQTGWLSDWLGLPRREDRYFVGAVGPAYDAAMLNAQAREFRPFLAVLGGVSCDYRADLGRNPLYRGVDLSGCDRLNGCAFCTPTHPPSSDSSADPLELARAQLSAAARAAARGRDRGRFNMRDIRLFRRLPEFFAMVEGLDLPPSEFFFSPRIDDLLKAGPEIERLLPRLAGPGHRLSLFRMGVEHFSPLENARFNKGVSAAQIDRGLELAARLKAAHPGRFDYAGPLGYIAFTPWTTLDALELSIGEGIKRGFDPQGPWLYSSLELAEGSPIAALARHEGGILRKSYDDDALRYSLMADSRSRPGLLPWRMKDPLAAAACSIIVRFCAVSLRGTMPDAVFSGDALYSWLARIVDGRKVDAKRPDLFAAELVRRMKTARPPTDKKKLILETLEALASLRAEEKPAAPRKPAPAHKAWLPLLAGLDAQFLREHPGPCSSRYDGEVILVSFGGESVPLLPVPKSPSAGAYYAQTPSFYICIRGKTRMSESEQSRLKLYLRLLAQRDKVLKALLRPAPPPKAGSLP